VCLRGSNRARKRAAYTGETAPENRGRGAQGDGAQARTRAARLQFVETNPNAETPVNDAPHPLQVKAWRRMGGPGRLELAAELRRKVIGWKRDALRAQHPAWSDEGIERAPAGIILRGNT